jgi:hypothetical protein
LTPGVNLGIIECSDHHTGGETPGPIPNPEVKPPRADDSLAPSEAKVGRGPGVFLWINLGRDFSPELNFPFHPSSFHLPIIPNEIFYILRKLKLFLLISPQNFFNRVRVSFSINEIGALKNIYQKVLVRIWTYN